MTILARIKAKLNKYVLTDKDDSYVIKFLKSFADEMGDDGTDNKTTQKIYDRFIENSNLDTATDFWIDYWGSIFGIYREKNESDDDFRLRIQNYIKIDKATIAAILRVMQPFSIKQITIEEYEPDDIFEGQNSTTKLYPFQYKIHIYIYADLERYVFAFDTATQTAGNSEYSCVAIQTFDSGKKVGTFALDTLGTGILKLARMISYELDKTKVASTMPIVIIHRE